MLWCSRARAGLIRHNPGGRAAFFADGGVRALGRLLSNPATAVSMRRKALQLMGDLAAVGTVCHRLAFGLVGPNPTLPVLCVLPRPHLSSTCAQFGLNPAQSRPP